MKRLANNKLSRRQWLLAGAATLAGCGGGGTNTSGALPGTGGTGIGVQGTISGFGSVIVNGTKYDDRTASIYLNGSTARSTELRIGMVANISGSLDSATNLGTANRIDVWSVASGPLKLADVVGSTFQMVGMRFTADQSTAFEGLVGLASITADTAVTVWGIQTSADGRNWLATRIKALSSTPSVIVTSGPLSAADGAVNGMTLSGAQLTGYADRQMVRVEGVLDSTAGVLTVSKLTALGADRLIPLSATVEVEGVVTRVTDANHFAVGTITVNATGAAKSGSNQAIIEGIVLEVSGVMQSGVLIANELRVQSPNEVMQVEITGTVDSFNSVSDFTVRGQKCDASNAVLQSGLLANLQVGTKVHLSGPSEGDDVLHVQFIAVNVL
jgi:hypothetical protein